MPYACNKSCLLLNPKNRRRTFSQKKKCGTEDKVMIYPVVAHNSSFPFASLQKWRRQWFQCLPHVMIIREASETIENECSHCEYTKQNFHYLSRYPLKALGLLKPLKYNLRQLYYVCVERKRTLSLRFLTRAKDRASLALVRNLKEWVLITIRCVGMVGGYLTAGHLIVDNVTATEF